MYTSLKKECSDFHLYILAFNDEALYILKRLDLDCVTVIKLSDFEDQELLRVKKYRSIAEYSWTCTSSVILYCIERFNLPECTYLDADLFFYDNPKILLEEMHDNDVLITPHRYTKEFDRSGETGIYCVQFITFRNNCNGLRILNWWRKACIDWCYSKPEDGKFGDQKYLDIWPTYFQGVHVLNNLGGGVAPWNIQQYDFFLTNQKLEGVEKSSGKKFGVIFFHFHAMLTYKPGILGEYYFDQYPISRRSKKLIYNPYFDEMRSQYLHLKNEFNFENLFLQKIFTIYAKNVRKMKINICGLYQKLKFLN